MKIKEIDIKLIDPSPFQIRKYFDPDVLKEFAASILREGQIAPIMVRPIGERYEIIVGEIRYRAVRDYTDMKTIRAEIIEATDLEARRKSFAENLLREDLSVIETIEGTVGMVDAELMEDKEYASMGKEPVDRVKALLGKLKAARRNEERGYNPSKEIMHTTHKFMRRVEKIFENIPKPLKWRSFYNNDLNLIVETAQEVQDVAIRHRLSKSQARALHKLNRASKSRFDSFLQESGISEKNKDRSDNPSPSKRGLKEFSASEIEAIAKKEIEKQTLAEQERLRETIPLVSKVKALLMSRQGIPVEIIASNLRINWKTAKRYGQDTGLFETVRKSLGDGLSVPIVAKKHALPEPLVWSVALEGKSDEDRFDALGWKIRPWDYWYWNNCDKRFGDDWPGRIPAQMVGHLLLYFSDQGALVMDPMGGGGGVVDTCLVFNRKCRSFDMVNRLDTRPEIEPHFWDINNLEWPIKGNDKPDLVIFDPPYFSKKRGDYDSRAISGMSKETYLDFMKKFLSLTHRYTKPTCRLAMINADWRDFQQTPARDEKRENAILIREYLEVLDESGWRENHVIQAPLSTERFTGNMVTAMKKKQTLGVISRYVMVASKAK